MAKTIFNMADGIFTAYKCGTIMTLFSPGDCTLQCDIWIWNRDSEFIKCQRPAM